MGIRGGRVTYWVLTLMYVLVLGATTGPALLSHAHQSYTLGANDVIRVQVFGEEDLTVESKIDGDGNITFPLLGVVHAAGKTVQELQEYLASQLASGYVRMPKVTAHVVRHRNFYVSGEVKSPGGFAYEEGTNVQKALSLAGGLTEKAERENLHILRQMNGRQEALPAKLDTVLQPDDILTVAERQRLYVSGEVKGPGRYLYENGLTVHKALSLAGGRTEKGERGSIKLTRVVDGVAETLIATPETVLLPDDILVVEADNHKFYASGEVKNPSSYPYKDGLTVHKAIAMAGGLTEKAERGTFHVLRQVDGHEQTVPVGLDSIVLPDDIIVVAEGQKFHIGGEVKTPGRYLYEKGMTAQRAVSMAGGWTEKAEKGTIKVTRLLNGVLEPIDLAPDAAVMPDDFIVVPQQKKVYVNGEVKRAGDYPYERGLTVHKAITMAGGFTDKAAESSTRVLRTVDGKEVSIKVNLDTVILPEDILVVPRSFF